METKDEKPDQNSWGSANLEAELWSYDQQLRTCRRPTPFRYEIDPKITFDPRVDGRYPVSVGGQIQMQKNAALAKVVCTNKSKQKETPQRPAEGPG